MEFDFMESLELIVLLKKKAKKLYQMAFRCDRSCRATFIEDARRFRGMYKKACKYYDSNSFVK